MDKVGQILFDTFSSVASTIENIFDRDDNLISREMSDILENKKDRASFYAAVDLLEKEGEDGKEEVKVTLSTGRTLDLVMK